MKKEYPNLYELSKRIGTLRKTEETQECLIAFIQIGADSLGNTSKKVEYPSTDLVPHR